MNCRMVPAANVATFLTLVASLLIAGRGFADECVGREFRIGKDGRCILLSLTLKGREILGLLDTGASGSAFDTALAPLLGEFRGTQTIQTPAGEKNVETFDWPDVRLGSDRLKSEKHVSCLDLDQARKAAGAEIFAILGMDVLKNYAIQIDFDSGILRLLDSLPEMREELGTGVPIVFAKNGTPSLRCTLSDGKEELFLIDTGSLGNSVETVNFDRLAGQGRIRPQGSSMSVTVNGAVVGEAGRLDLLSVGPFQRENLRVARINVSSLGLRYLSRFRVTFDFPGKIVYLRKGDHFSRPEPTATSGMSLAWSDGDVVVLAVLKGGPAERAGIKPDDVLLRIDGTDALRYDHHSLRTLLTSEIGKCIPLTIRRSSRDYEVKIVLVAK